MGMGDWGLLHLILCCADSVAVHFAGICAQFHTHNYQQKIKFKVEL